MPSRDTCTYLRVTHRGYLLVRMRKHPRADVHGWVLQHIVIAEMMYGAPLPRGAVVHHMDRLKDNNCFYNLFIMANQAEHGRIHAAERQRDPHQTELWIGIEYPYWAARNPLLPRPQ